MSDRLSISLLTREYPPFIYGGAGVHVAQLVPQLRKLIDVDVQAMGEPREGATAHLEHAGARAELIDRYATVVLFWRAFAETIPWGSTDTSANPGPYFKNSLPSWSMGST